MRLLNKHEKHLYESLMMWVMEKKEIVFSLPPKDFENHEVSKLD